ncbi:MAG: ribonuclease E/G, partial [Lachnospiraceae bacterium]|nr:ribonuclease E/G [Lachnospiraceae bacterium]
MNDNKLIITKYRDLNAAFLFKDGDIDELILSRENAFNVGDIYVGRVSTVKNDLKACFVEFKEGVNGYLSFEDIYPECLLNRPYDGRLVQGDLVCVEVVKEPLKTKGATLSMHLTVTGALSVITLDDPCMHISSKLPKDYKREADAYFKGKSFGYGFVVRTNAAEASFDEIEAEIKKNSEILKNVTSVMNFRSAFTCLYKADSSFVQRIRSISTERYDEAVTDCQDFYDNLSGLKNLRLYTDTSMPLKALYSFDKAYSLATDRKVDFKYGGYLIIEPTEALTVIDVNSGKFTKNVSKEEA